MPVFSEAKLIEIYGRQKGVALVDRVCRVTDEANKISIDWANETLETSGKTVRTEMRRRYPSLSGEALDVIAWNFTFDWR